MNKQMFTVKYRYQFHQIEKGFIASLTPVEIMNKYNNI